MLLCLIIILFLLSILPSSSARLFLGIPGREYLGENTLQLKSLEMSTPLHKLTKFSPGSQTRLLLILFYGFLGHDFFLEQEEIKWHAIVAFLFHFIFKRKINMLMLKAFKNLKNLDNYGLRNLKQEKKSLNCKTLLMQQIFVRYIYTML